MKRRRRRRRSSSSSSRGTHSVIVYRALTGNWGGGIVGSFLIDWVEFYIPYPASNAELFQYWID